MELKTVTVTMQSFKAMVFEINNLNESNARLKDENEHLKKIIVAKTRFINIQDELIEFMRKGE